MRIPVLANISLIFQAANGSLVITDPTMPAKPPAHLDNAVTKAMHRASTDPNLKTNQIPDEHDLRLKDDISEEILDFFTNDSETAAQAPQLPAPIHAQYSADIVSLMEQIQLDTDEVLLHYLSGQANPIDSKDIQIELLDPNPDESAQLLQTRYQVLCELLGLDAAASSTVAPRISTTNLLLKITTHAFRESTEAQNYFMKLLQRLTS